MNPRTVEIIKKYNSGISKQKIADEYKISWQRVWQIIKENISSVNYVAKHNCKKVNSTVSEKYVYKIFDSLNIKYKAMPYMASFDVLVGNSKVEIKYKKNPSKHIQSGKEYFFYKFQYLKPLYPIDYYIFICGDIKKNPLCYVYPAKKIGGFKRIPFNTRSNIIKNKYSQYLNNFNILS